MKKEYKKLIEAAENLGWTVDIDGNTFAFSKHSPAGLDFNIEVNAKSKDEVVEELQEKYNGFDCSEETYLWLDKTGHGTNGAPYDMKDVYKDMEACQDMLGELYEGLEWI